MANLYGDLRVKKVVASGDISTTRDALISGTLYVSGHSMQPIGPGVLLVDGVVVSGSAGGGSGGGSGITFISGSGLFFVHTQTTPATTWTVAHNANSRDFNINVFDTSGSYFLPNQINTIDANTVQIVNSIATAGKVVLQFGFLQSPQVSGTLYVHTQATLDNVWTITHNQNTTNFLIQTFGVSGELFFPNDIRPLNANQIAVGHTTTRSGTAVVAFNTTNFTATQQSQYVHTQSSPAVTWNIIHNLGTLNFDITLFDSSGHVFWPDDIYAQTVNKVVITNAFARAGTAVLVFQNAGVQMVPQSQFVHSQSTAQSVWTINHAMNSTQFNVDFFDLSGHLFIPDDVQYSGMNFVIATNTIPIAGTAVFTFKNSAVGLFHENAPYEQRVVVGSGSIASGVVFSRYLPLTFYNSVDRGKVYQVSLDGTGPLLLDSGNTLHDNDFYEIPVDSTDMFDRIAFNDPIVGPANIIVWAPGITDGSSYSVQQIAGNTTKINSLLAFPMITGLTLSNNGSGGITAAAGSAIDASTLRAMTLSSSMTKLINAPFTAGSGVGGLDSGVVQNNTWYHFFLIGRSDTGGVDGLFSTSPASPSMPSSYDTKRRIGSVRTAAGTISGFVQLGDEFLFQLPSVFVNSTVGLSTTRALFTTMVPTGFKNIAIVNLATYATTSYFAVRIYSPDQLDIRTPELTNPNNANFGAYGNGDAEVGAGQQMRIRTDISGQIGAIANTTAAIFGSTAGYIDRRGQDGDM